MRLLTPLLFLATAAVVAWYNGSHQATQLLFPGAEGLFEGDAVAAGRLTWQVFLGLGLAASTYALYSQTRSARRRRAAS